MDSSSDKNSGRLLPRGKQASAQLKQGVATRPNPRNYALDNLRVFLTALVIMHHTAIPYGGSGSWKFRSRCFPAESIALIIFNALDQTFFMGMFFFISGVFTRIRLSRKQVSSSELIVSRVQRLLLPAIVHTLLVLPTLDVLVHIWGQGGTGGAATDLWEIYVSSWSQIRGIQGQAWYLALVALLDLVAILLHWTACKRTDCQLNQTFKNKHFWVPAAWTTTIISSFAIRVVYPVGTLWLPLGLQLAYLPQYILAYTTGHLSAFSGDYFIWVPFQRGIRKPLRKLAFALLFCFFSLGVVTALEEHLLGIEPARIVRLTHGGFNIPSLVYAAWNELGFVLIGFSLLAVFLQYCNSPWRYGGQTLSRYSYAAFLLHPLVSLVIELALESAMDCQEKGHGLRDAWTMVGPILMTLVVGPVNILMSWVAAWFIVSNAPVIGSII